MEQLVLDYTRRTPKGSGAAKRLRRDGTIPGILYGHKQDPVPLSLPQEELVAALREGRQMVTLQDGPRSEMALIKDIQYDSLGSSIIHVDFSRVALDEKVAVSVSIELSGTPKGLTEGGVLDHVAKELNVECLATAIPEVIRISVAEMEIDQALHVSDLPLPDGVVATDDAESVVVVLHPPRVEEEEEEEEAEAAEESDEPEVIGRKAEEEGEEESEEP